MVVTKQHFTKHQLLEGKILVYLTTFDGPPMHSRIEIHDGMSCVYLSVEEAVTVAKTITKLAE